jgi:transposase
MEEGRKRRRFDKGFKLDAIRLVTEGGRSVQDVARELGIDPNTVYHWKRELLQEGDDAFPGKGHLTVQEEEIRRLRKELAEAKRGP